jgi:hypothetical protein
VGATRPTHGRGRGLGDGPPTSLTWSAL